MKIRYVRTVIICSKKYENIRWEDFIVLDLVTKLTDLFQVTWSLLVPPLGSTSSCGVSCGHLGTVGGLREAGRALWALLREMDTSFLQEFTLPRKSLPLDAGNVQLCVRVTSFTYFEENFVIMQEGKVEIKNSNSKPACNRPLKIIVSYKDRV